MKATWSDVEENDGSKKQYHDGNNGGNNNNDDDDNDDDGDNGNFIAYAYFIKLSFVVKVLWKASY